MGKKLTLEEAAELLGITSFELKVSRQKGMAPGSLGRVEESRLVFDADELRGEPRTKKKEPEPEEAMHDRAGYEPEDLGAGWYRLSDGAKVRGKEAALKAQSKLEA